MAAKAINSGSPGERGLEKRCGLQAEGEKSPNSAEKVERHHDLTSTHDDILFKAKQPLLTREMILARTSVRRTSVTCKTAIGR